MNRREFITLLGGAAAWPLAVRAQQSTGQPLVGLLSPLSAAAWVHILGAFRRGMRDLGYVEGANVAFAFRFADGQVTRLPALANELVAIKPAVIAVGSTAAVLETHKATRTIPIVMVTSQDPTAVGLAASLARPGGNVTGFWTEGDEALIGKQLDLLKHVVPGIARVGVMVNPDDTTDARSLKALPAAARRAGGGGIGASLCRRGSRRTAGTARQSEPVVLRQPHPGHGDSRAGGPARDLRLSR